jgi:pyruvate kinase
MIIKKCNDAGKVVITATQMLESMIKSPVPTRAEVSDIANAILDGTDAIMLSEETTLGEYPIEAVNVMAKVAFEIEHNYPERKLGHIKQDKERDITDSVTESVVDTAHDVGAKAIIALTETGFTARMISRYKPKLIVISFTPNEVTYNQLHLSFGCYPVKIPRFKSFDDVSKYVRTYCLKQKIAEKGDRVIVTGGIPFSNRSGSTNTVTIETI